MTKEVLYTYLGDNGTITSPVHLDGIFSVKKVRLRPDTGKYLRKEGTNVLVQGSKIVPENEVDLWEEV